MRERSRPSKSFGTNNTADMVIRAFAKVGIIALIDEATGYQAERVRKDELELQRILAAYISPELMPWAKKFPDEFYEQLFRLRGWQYKPISVRKPRIVGKITSQIVYEKLPPGVLEEMREKNPADEEGRRKRKHHQFLTEDIGHPHLKDHLLQVIMLMRVSPKLENVRAAVRPGVPSRRCGKPRFRRRRGHHRRVAPAPKEFDDQKWQSGVEALAGDRRLKTELHCVITGFDRQVS